MHDIPSTTTETVKTACEQTELFAEAQPGERKAAKLPASAAFMACTALDSPEIR